MNDEQNIVSNPSTLKEKIDFLLHDLTHFKNRASTEYSRTELLSQLSIQLCEYYGYIQELTDFLLELFSPTECVEYMEYSDKPRPLVIRTNTLKTTRRELVEKLTKRGVTAELIPWSKTAIKINESSVPIGATPEYLAGHYMLQSAASLNPVMALDPKPGEKILDMSAAPGGKTSYVAQLMQNSGSIIANDLKPMRQKATIANLHRLGVKNTIVSSYDGRKITHIFKGFDRVLLDAPCSGLGVISRDQSVKLQRSVKDIQRIAHLQKELLRAAVDACDPKSSGGIIVYSTCSISTEENEQVIDYILSRRFVNLVDTGLEVGKPGFTKHKERRFHSSMTLTRRFYPHVHNMDGFFVAKLKKYANGVKGSEDDEEAMMNENLSDHDDVGESNDTDDIMIKTNSKSIQSKDDMNSTEQRIKSSKNKKTMKDDEHSIPQAGQPKQPIEVQMKNEKIELPSINSTTEEVTISSMKNHDNEIENVIGEAKSKTKKRSITELRKQMARKKMQIEKN